MIKSADSGKKKFGIANKDFSEAVEKAHSFSKKYKNTQEIPDEMLPETWDWRNINGYDFTSDLYDQ